MTKKLKIGFDFDDVLISSADHTVMLYNKLYQTMLTRDDWYDDPLIVAPWKVDDFSTIIRRVVDIHADEQFLDVAVLPGAREVLRALKEQGHELVVITGRPIELLLPTIALLEKHYADIFTADDLRFTDYFGHSSTPLKKGDVAVELGLTHFIDDVVPHANDVASRGVTVLLFDAGYKWNQFSPNEGVQRVKSWQDIGKFFDGQVSGK